LLPPICAVSQCFYADGVGHKKSKNTVETAANVDFIGHRRKFSAVPGFAG
jgi:hypothetical protein